MHFCGGARARLYLLAPKACSGLCFPVDFPENRFHTDRGFSERFSGNYCSGQGAALPALPGTADDRQVVRLRRKRNRGAHLYLVRHVSNTSVTDRLSEGVLAGDGEAAFQWLRTRNRTVPDVTDNEKLN